MTAVTPSGEALAKALHGCTEDLNPDRCEECRRCINEADALIASGAVVPLDTLADDEALVDRFIDALGTWPTEPGIRETSRKVARTYLRALAAALSERGDR
jgi:hypothetical protein